MKTYFTPALPLVITLLTCLTVTGCKRYQLTLNEQVLYSPPTLFTDFKTEDNNLRQCLDQTIKDHAVSKPTDLTQLNCSHAGIGSLQGLEIFTGLIRVNLKHNNVSDLYPLRSLSQLKVLDLSENRLQELQQLLTLPRLQEVNLEGNEELDCQEVAQLRATGELKVLGADQCGS